MTASGAVDRATWEWRHLSSAMKAVVLFAAFVGAVVTLWATIVRPLYALVESDQAWRESVTNALTCPPPGNVPPPEGSLCAQLLAQDRAIAALMAAVDLQDVTLRDLTRPVEIFETAPFLEPIACPPSNATCKLPLLIHRTLRGLPCKVLPEGPRIYVSSLDQTRVLEVAQVNAAPRPPNFGLEFAPFMLEFDRPPGFTGLVMARFTQYYDRCLGENDPVVVADPSEAILLDFGPLSATPAPQAGDAPALVTPGAGQSGLTIGIPEPAP